MAILVQSNKKPSVSFPSQTGNIITFNSGFAGLPLKSCKVNIPVTQEGTGDPSPDNVRNFVGISSLDFTANSVVRTFQFGQTIYVGELNVLTGIFTATHKLVNVADLDISISATGYFNFNLFDIKLDEYIYDSDIHSNLLEWGGDNTRTNTRTWLDDKTFAFVPWARSVGSTRLAIKGSGTETTVEELKQTLANATILYELAEPEIINLGGMDVETLQGENNLFASTGETTASIIKIGG